MFNLKCWLVLGGFLGGWSVPILILLVFLCLYIIASFFSYFLSFTSCSWWWELVHLWTTMSSRSFFCQSSANCARSQCSTYARCAPPAWEKCAEWWDQSFLNRSWWVLAGHGDTAVLLIGCVMFITSQSFNGASPVKLFINILSKWMIALARRL